MLMNVMYVLPNGSWRSYTEAQWLTVFNLDVQYHIHHQGRPHVGHIAAFGMRHAFAIQWLKWLN